MTNSCRICMEDKVVPLYKRCSCSSGYFHDACFVKWISYRTSLSCEVCKKRFKGAFVQLGNIRTYSSISFKYFSIVTIFLHLMTIIIWVYIKFFSDIVYCVHHMHPSTCSKYNLFRTFVFFVNIMFSFVTLMFIFTFKKFPQYFGIILDAPICRILLTNPHDTFTQNIPVHPDLLEQSNNNESITIHNSDIDFSHTIIDTALANESNNTIASVEDDPDNTDDDDDNDNDNDDDNDDDNNDDVNAAFWAAFAQLRDATSDEHVEEIN